MGGGNGFQVVLALGLKHPFRHFGGILRSVRREVDDRVSGGDVAEAVLFRGGGNAGFGHGVFADAVLFPGLQINIKKQRPVVEAHPVVHVERVSGELEAFGQNVVPA